LKTLGKYSPLNKQFFKIYHMNITLKMVCLDSSFNTKFHIWQNEKQ